MDMGWIVTVVSPTSDTAQINLMTSENPAPPSDISVEVGDVDAVHAEAVRRGLRIVYPLTDEPWGVRRFFVEDPNGKVVNVLRHVRGRGRPANIAGPFVVPGQERVDGVQRRANSTGLLDEPARARQMERRSGVGRAPAVGASTSSTAGSRAWPRWP